MENDVILLLVGLIVGVMNAIAGGGMLVALPVMIAMGIPPIVVAATTPLIVSPGSFASAVGYRKYLKKVPLKYAWLLLSVVVGGAAGALTLRNTASGHFAELVPVLVLIGVLLFALQPFISHHLHGHIKGKKKSKRSLYILALAIVPLSFYGGYFGPGFGFILLAFLSFTNLHDVHMMNAMKNVSGVVLSLVSMVCLYSSNLIDWRIGAIMAVGTIIGGYGGARYVQRLSGHWLRGGIIATGLLAVVYLSYYAY